MQVLAGMWRSLRHEFFPTARRARLPRPLPLAQPLTARLRGLFQLWRDWLRRRVWLHCDHPHLASGEITGLRGVVEIRGWAVAVDGITAVTISCDSALVGTALRGVRRRDLTRRFPHLRRVSRAGFYFALDSRSLTNGLHELTVTARTQTGQTLHVSGRVQVHNDVTAYERWRRQTTPNAAALAWMRRHTPSLPWRPIVSLVLSVQTEQQAGLLARTVASLRAQAYPHWQLVATCPESHWPSLPRDDRICPIGGAVASEASARNRAREHADGDLIGPLDAGDELGPAALFEIVYFFNRHPSTDLVYTDEETCSPEGAVQPAFKPGWSSELLLGMNCVGRMWIARRHLLGQEGPYASAFRSAAEYDLLLRLTERATAIRHLSAVLVRRPLQPELAPENARNAIRAALRRRGETAEVVAGLTPSTWRIRRPGGERELVSVIVQADGSAARQLLDSLTARTAYRDYELHLVPSGGPGLAERLNKAADAARGQYLLFVRAAAILTDDWIEALCNHARRPSVAVVGGHLTDATGRITDAGLLLTDDDRLLAPAAESDSMPAPLLSIDRECAAVSRDCLMVRRERFLELGGFDDRLDGRLLEADFCLHARARGYTVISTPYARLLGAAPLAPPTAVAVELYRTRWDSHHAVGDPFDSPNSARQSVGGVNAEPLFLTHAPAPLFDRESIHRILAVKLDHVGDVLLAMPAVRRLRELFPEAEITLLVGPHARQLVAREPAVDRVLQYEYFYASSSRPHKQLTDDDRRDVRALLAGAAFDLAIDLRREIDTREIIRLSGARWTVGFANPGEVEWLSVALPCEGVVALQKARRHMAQDSLRLVDMVAQVMAEPASVQTPASSAQIAALDALLAEILPVEPRLLIGLHPGSGRPIKCWPASSFGRLAGLLAERLGATVVVFGGRDEIDLANEVLRHAPAGAPVASLAGRLDLAELSTALGRCDLFVGNDSGPTHLAAAVGIPTLGVYAGTVDPSQWAPLGPNAAALQRGMLCAPCYLGHPRECPIGVACMRQLHPEQAFEAAIRLLLPRWHKLPAISDVGAGERRNIAREFIPN